MRTALVLVLFIAACGSSEPASTTPAAPEPAATEPAADPAPEPAASSEEVFRDAIVSFAESGSADQYKALLSQRMLKRFAERQAEMEADPAKLQELKEAAKQMGVAEPNSVIEFGAAIWHKEFAAVLDKGLRTSTVVVAEGGNRNRAVFEGVTLANGDKIQITVANEDGVLKIDEN